VDYPVSAKDLPESLKLAYADGALPIDVSIPELDQILAGMKQRGRDKLKEPAWLQNVPLEYRSLVTMQMKKQTCSTPCEPELPMPSDMADMVQKIRSGMLPAPFLKREPGVAPSASQHSVCSHLFPHVPVKLVHASQVKKEEQTADEDESGKATNAGKTELDDMEKHMAAAAVARAKGKPNKKKAKDWDAKSAERVLKKPAAAKAATPKVELSVVAPKKGAKAATAKEGHPIHPKKTAATVKVAKTVMKKKAVSREKKPVSKAAIALEKKINMKDVFKRLREQRNDAKMYRNKFTSHAYAHGSKRALDDGARSETAKEFAGMMLGKASKLWDATA
jgi:hypothetical protein